MSPSFWKAGEVSREVICPQRIVAGGRDADCLVDDGVNFDHLVEGVSARCRHCEVITSLCH